MNNGYGINVSQSVAPQLILIGSLAGCNWHFYDI